MKKRLVVFFQIMIVFIGICVFSFMLWEPHLEGRNIHSTLFEIYFKDPFLAYVYIGSLPFFVLLYNAFRVFGYIGQNKALSQETIGALRIIKYSALCVIGFVAGGEIFIILNNSDDRAGGVFMGILIAFGSIMTLIVSAIFEKILKKICY